MKLRFILPILLLCLVTGIVSAQKTDTTYYDQDWNKSAKAGSSFYRVSESRRNGKLYVVTDYFNSGKVQMTGSFLSFSPEIKDGEFISYYENGNKKSQVNFQRGEVIMAKYWNESGQETAAPEGPRLDKQPEFPGGMNQVYKYISENFRYPPGLIPRPKGKILIKFVIDKDGSTTDVFAAELVHPLLDAEAIRLVKNMPKWEPGSINGKAVKVYYTLPISMQ